MTEANKIEPKVAMIANLVDHKGHEVLFKAISLLKTRGRLVHARLIGGEKTKNKDYKTSGFKQKLEILAQELKINDLIEFYGYASNVYEAIKGYSIIVLPSDGEGLPNSIIEAMSIKKIVVVSAVGGVPEFIKHGVNGFMHPSRNYEKLADVLEQVITFPANRWGNLREEAYITWKSNYSTEKVMAEFLDVYSNLGAV